MTVRSPVRPQERCDAPTYRPNVPKTQPLTFYESDPHTHAEATRGSNGGGPAQCACARAERSGHRSRFPRHHRALLGTERVRQVSSGAEAHEGGEGSLERLRNLLDDVSLQILEMSLTLNTVEADTARNSTDDALIERAAAHAMSADPVRRALADIIIALVRDLPSRRTHTVPARPR